MAPVVNKTLAVLAAAGIGIVTYAIYFDHKRRTDANFRKRLRMLNSCILHYVLFTTPSGREKKKLDKSAAQEAASSEAAGDAPLPTEEILAAMVLVKDDQVPTTPEEREKYFMSQVEKGEQLCVKGRSTLRVVEDVCSLCREGPEFAVEAALAFFRALRVYPSPVELIMIFQNTVPEPIFKVCSSLFSSFPLN
jgi:import receptor subunit TOM20